MMRAMWNGQVIAEAPQTVQVEGRHYFPAEAVRQEFFTDSATTSVCGWKGNANYYSLEVDGRTNADAAWYYANPKSAAAGIKDHVAFWKGVTVEGTPETSGDKGATGATA